MRGQAFWSVLLTLLFVGSVQSLAAVALQPIALSGQPIPNQPGLSYSSMSSGVAIAPDGSVAFQANTSAPGFALAVFAYDPVLGVRQVAHVSNAAPVNDPNLSNPIYSDFYGTPAAASGGQTIYAANTQPTYQNNTYYFLSTPAATGLAAPRYSNGMYIAPDSGNVAYTAGQPDSYTVSALMYGPVQAPITVATVGAPAAGVPGSNYFSLAPISANNGGSMMFASTLSNGAGDAIYHATFTSYTPNVQLIARNGMPAAGVPGAPPISNLHIHSASREGHALISGIISGAPASSDLALWTLDTTGSMRLVAREGLPLPGAAGFSNPIFGGSLQDVDIGDGGHVAFKQNIGGTDGLWRWSFMENTLEMLNVPGRQIPGMPIGWRFGGTLGRPQLDEFGNAVFYDAVRDPFNVVKSSLVFAGIDGVFKIIVREGEIVNVNGVNKQVSFIGHPLAIYGNHWLSPRTINDSFQVALSLKFTDGGSGVFIARVPEPGAGAIVIAALLWHGFSTRIRSARINGAKHTG